jgi:pimeloyl-ACP methyl ester carboxylesterase
VIKQEPATLTARDGATFEAVLHYDDAAPKNVAFLMMHPSSDWRQQFLLAPLAARGFGALGCANRYFEREAELILEETLLDWAACVDHLRSRGYEKIVGIGYSGGGEIAAGYQSEAVHPSISGSPMSNKPDFTKFSLHPMDGLVMLNAHAGRPFSLTLGLDPSVGGESGNNPLVYERLLDMFNPENGPPFNDAFRTRYREAQIERNHKITRWCQKLIGEIDASGNPLMKDIPIIIHRADANLGFLDRDPAEAGKRESTRWGIDAKVANYTPGPMRGPNTRMLVVTPRSWLSQRSLAASQFDLFKFLPNCHVPTLVLWGTADAAGSEHSDHIFKVSPDPDRTFVRIESGTHFMRGQADKQAEVVDNIAKWVEERGLN